jgi:hypothetical protein
MNEESYIKLHYTKVEEKCRELIKHIKQKRCEQLTKEYNEYVDKHNNNFFYKLLKIPKLEFIYVKEYVKEYELPQPIKDYIEGGEDACERSCCYYRYGSQYKLCKELLKMCDSLKGTDEQYIFLSRSEYNDIL